MGRKPNATLVSFRKALKPEEQFLEDMTGQTVRKSKLILGGSYSSRVCCVHYSPVRRYTGGRACFPSLGPSQQSGLASGDARTTALCHKRSVISSDRRGEPECGCVPLGLSQADGTSWSCSEDMCSGLTSSSAAASKVKWPDSSGKVTVDYGALDGTVREFEGEMSLHRLRHLNALLAAGGTTGDVMESLGDVAFLEEVCD